MTTGDRRSHDRDRQQAGSRQLCVHKRSFHFIASHADVLFEAPPQFPSLCPERSLLKAPCDQNIERGGGGEMHKLQSPNYCLKSRFPGTVSVKFMIDPGCKQIYVKHRIFCENVLKNSYKAQSYLSEKLRDCSSAPTFDFPGMSTAVSQLLRLIAHSQTSWSNLSRWMHVDLPCC